MKHCVKFPDDKFLAVRPCLVAICMGNRPAAKLLGALLFRYNLRVENKDDAENQNAIKEAKGEQADQDTSFHIYRKQSQLIDDMCEEMTEKTLHDTAVPMLQLLGYLDIEEHMQANRYTLNIELVQQALNLYNHPQLEKFLISHMQLEKFLITSDELEKFLIDKKNFQSGLEKVLIWNRNTSNCQRGRKPAPEGSPKGKSRTSKNLKESSKKEDKEKSNGESSNTPTFDANASQPPASLQEVEHGILPSNDSSNAGSYPLAHSSNPLPAAMEKIVDKAQTPSQEPYSQQPGAIRDKLNNKKVTQAKPAASPSKPKIVLTAEQQTVFDEWCKMPWFMGVAPALERNDPEHLQRLSVYQPTMGSMLKVMNWAKSKEVDRNGWYKGKKWKLYALAKEYPEWASVQFEEPVQLSEARSALDERSARNLEKLKAKGAARLAAPPAQSATA